MKFKDISIRKKITLTNFMMIVIPVLIVLLIMVGILVGILAGTGSGITISTLEKFSGKTTNYQLQMMVDSLSEELVESAQPLKEGSVFLKICSDLERLGTDVLVTEGTRACKGRRKKSAQQGRGRHSCAMKTALFTARRHRTESKPIPFLL